MNIFLSYAKADTYDLAMWLDEQFNSMPGVTCWVDRDLSPGYYWAHQIQIEIQKCDVMVVLISPDVNRVPDDKTDMSFVLKEVGFAQSLRKKIVPALAQETFIPIVLQGLHYIDLTGSKLDIGKDHLLGLIQDLAENAEHEIPILVPVDTDELIAKLPPVPSILHPPFEWVHISAGIITLTEDLDLEGYLPKDTFRDFHVPKFVIAKYPITKAQYAVFKGDGYLSGQGDHPVTEVSWFEAIEFCQWLSEKTNLSITLPTEQQWQRAAQGNTEWEYPWGDEFDSSRCNTTYMHFTGTATAVYYIGTTTSVTQYPDGVSPYGVMDMSGNCWEWTLTDYETGVNDMNNGTLQPCVSRDWGDPNRRNLNYGFRVVCSPLS